MQLIRVTRVFVKHNSYMRVILINLFSFDISNKCLQQMQLYIGFFFTYILVGLTSQQIL